MSRKPIAKLTAKIGQQSYSVLSIWAGNYPGTYSIAREKGTEKYPQLGLFDALKSWGKGEAFLNVSIESQREQRGDSNGYGSRGGNAGGQGGGDDFGAGDFGDGPDLPF